jgi:hypothetical protein
MDRLRGMAITVAILVLGGAYGARLIDRIFVLLLLAFYIIGFVVLVWRHSVPEETLPLRFVGNLPVSRISSSVRLPDCTQVRHPRLRFD